MSRTFKKRFLIILISVIIAVFAILMIINETNLFKHDQTHTFDEAVQAQTGEGMLNTKEDNGRFVNASKEDVRRAMIIKSTIIILIIWIYQRRYRWIKRSQPNFKRQRYL